MSPLPAWYNCKKKKKIEKRFVKCQRVQVEEIKGDFLLKTFYTFDTFPVEQLRIIIFNHEMKMIRLQPVQVNNNSVQKD